LLSLVEPDLPATPSPAPTTGTPTDAGPPIQATATVGVPTAPATSTKQTAEIAKKSKEHFTKVKQLVTEVRFPSSDLKIVSAGAFGAWIDRQARRIDQLPILGIDPELLDYSQGVAQSLRTTAAKQRGATISAAAGSSRRTRYTDYYTGQSYVSESDFQIQSRMETAAANLSHVDVMRMIDDETAQIRRRLTNRYQIEF
jgi:hypothetical protein